MFELLLKHSPWAYRAGELAFASGWPVWLLFALIGAGLVFIAWSLWRQRYLTWPRRLLLGTLQLLFLALALTLLWRPVLNVERVRDRQNVVAVVMDASASMLYGDGERSRLQEGVDALQDGTLDALRKIFAVRLFSFADETAPLADIDAMPPPGPQSRIGDTLYRVLQTASGAPLAGVVLLTDGAENGGTLSEERLAELASFGIPVHTIGVGAEKIENDLELDSVSLAQNATPSEMLTAEVSIRHSGAAKTRLRVYDGQKLLAARDIALSADAGVTTHTLELPAGDPGVRDLRFTVDPLEGERNTINNTRTHVIDVAPSRRSVLYVEGEPRWEYKFIRRAAESDRSLRLASVVRVTPNRHYRQGVQSEEELVDGFPRDAVEMFSYDAIVIGSLEAAALSAEQHQILRDFVDRRGGGLLMLAGRDGLSDGGWGRFPLAQTLPVHLGNRSETSFVRSPVKARLTTYGAESIISRFDPDPKRNAAQWDQMPPLADFQPLGALKPGAIVLLEAVGTGRPSPLLVWQRYGRGSTYVLATGSTWRWKMRLPFEDQRHHMFWRQMLHALAANAPPRTTLTTERKVYEDERRIVVHADLRDERFQPLNDAAVELTLSSEKGELTTYQMRRAAEEEGRYMAVLDADSAGLHRIGMTALVDGKEVATAATHIRRNEGVLEHFGTQQNRPLLERLASMTGGRYWRVDDLDGLPEAIRYSKAGVIERQTLDLWNLPAAFLLLLALKAGEWLLRLRWRTL